MWLYFLFSLKWIKISEGFDFFVETKLRLREGGLFIALRLMLWRMVACGFMLVMRFRRMVARCLWGVSLSCLTLDVVLVVASPDVFIEDCAVATLEGVLLTVLCTEMIDLTSQSEIDSSRD